LSRGLKYSRTDRVRSVFNPRGAMLLDVIYYF
jgi:hypothetical protein